MNTDTWIIYVTTVLVFMATPGPSHLLMLSVSIRHGFAKATATAAGDLSANAIQMLLAGAGLATIITQSQSALTAIKWLGVAFLLWMGMRQFFGAGSALSSQKAAQPKSRKSLWLLGFLTSAANPKAVIFFAALFPQFIEPDQALAPQLLVLGLSYLIIDGAFLCFYGKSAAWLSSRLDKNRLHWAQKFSGLSLIGAAVLLGLRSTARQ